MKIFIGPSTYGKFDDKPLRILKEKGIEFTANDRGRTLTEEEIAAELKEMDGIIAGLEPLTEKVLSGAPKLKVISRSGIGMDNVDIATAQARGIKVENTPDAPTDAVAELTLGLILDLCRKISLQNGKMKKGVWEKNAGFLLRGKTVGIVGLGRIGRRLCWLLAPFEPTILFYDPYVMESTGGYQKVGLSRLLEQSHIVSLHIPYTEETKGMINGPALASMKKEALLINVSRGGLIDEEALYQALKEDSIGGAALDTFAEEPYKGKLRELESVVLTPHIGSLARETRIQMELEAMENLLKHLIS